MYILLLIQSCIISIITFVLTKETLLTFLDEKELYVRNYSGRKVQTSGGFLLLVSILPTSIPFVFIYTTPIHIFYVLMIITLTFSGLIDDILGDDTIKGLKSHILTFFKGRFTTGILKALTDIILGILLSILRTHNIIYIILDMLVFILCINCINLLDLRPGRAIKGFVFFISIITLIAKFVNLHYIIPISTLLLIYIKGEMDEKYMLGDAGANLLGGILGFYAVLVLQPIHKIILFIFQSSLHLLAEIYSLSILIEQVPFLRYLDKMGRMRREER